MQITGYGAIDQTQWPYDQPRKTRSSTESNGSRGDTVTFSDEALELLARAQAAKINAEQSASETSQDSKAREEQEHSAGESSDSESSPAATAIASAAGSRSSSSSGGFGETAKEHSEGRTEETAVHEQNKAAQESGDGDDIDAQIDKLKNEIVKLAQKISQIYSLPGDDNMKQGMAQPYEDRINQLQQQIAALEAKKEKQAESASGGEK